MRLHFNHKNNFWVLVSVSMVEFLGPGGGHGRGTSFHPLLLDLGNLRVVWPVHRVEVLVGLVHAVPRLVVIKMVEVDASHREDSKSSGQSNLAALAPKVLHEPHNSSAILFRGGVLEKLPGRHQLLDHGLGVLRRHDVFSAVRLSCRSESSNKSL